MVTGLSVAMTTAIPQVTQDRSALHELYSLSYLWYSTLGLIIAVGVGLLATAVTGPMKAEEVDPRLLIPVCDRLCCYLPWSVRRHFYCGAEYQTEESRESSPEDINELNSKTKLVRGEGGDIGAGDQTSDIQLKSIKSLHDS